MNPAVSVHDRTVHGDSPRGQSGHTSGMAKKAMTVKQTTKQTAKAGGDEADGGEATGGEEAVRMRHLTSSLSPTIQLKSDKAIGHLSLSLSLSLNLSLILILSHLRRNKRSGEASKLTKAMAKIRLSGEVSKLKAYGEDKAKIS